MVKDLEFSFYLSHPLDCVKCISSCVCTHTHQHKSTFTNIDSCQELSLVMIFTLKSVTVDWSETILTCVKISFLFFSGQDAHNVLMYRCNSKRT